MEQVWPDVISHAVAVAIGFGLGAVAEWVSHKTRIRTLQKRLRAQPRTKYDPPKETGGFFGHKHTWRIGSREYTNGKRLVVRVCTDPECNKKEKVEESVSGAA
jgi:hypothetical protein